MKTWGRAALIISSCLAVACGSAENDGDASGSDSDQATDAITDRNEQCINDGDCEVGAPLPGGGQAVGIEDNLSEGDETEVEPEPETCAEAQVEFEEVIPQVFMILDQSGSMGWSMSDDSDAPDGERRWDVLGDVLFGDGLAEANSGVIGAYNDVVSFSSLFYTTSNNNNSCANALTEVPVSLKNYGRISTQYDALEPGGGTPTADAFVQLTETAKNTPSSGGPKIMIIATDGVPYDCDVSGTDESGVEAAVTAAFDQKLITYLVFIGPPPQAGTHEEHLQAVANLGQGKAADDSSDPAEYFTAESEDKLRAAFGEIIGNTRSCQFEVEGEVDPELANTGTVLLNDEPLLFGDEDGWQLNGNDEVELLGSACDSLKSGQQSVDIQFPCEAYTPDKIK